jgi:hypothetical protein
MRRGAQRYILEVNGFDCSELSVFVQGADGEALSACRASNC